MLTLSRLKQVHYSESANEKECMKEAFSELQTLFDLMKTLIPSFSGSYNVVS